MVVTDARAAPTNLVYPAVLAPVSATGAPLAVPDGGGPGYSWDDARAPEGQVGIVVSQADRRIYVLRGGVPIGEAPLELAPAAAGFHGTTLFVMGEGTTARASALDPDRPGHRWTAYPILDDPRTDAEGGLAAGQVPLDVLERPSLPVRLPPGFAQRLYDVLVPGTTVLVTDLPALRPLGDEQVPQPVLESDG